MTRPFPHDLPLTNLRYDLIESGLDIERFHASDDRQAVREQVFRIIADHLDAFRVDTVLVEKRKTAPALRADSHFYPTVLGHLIRHVLLARDSAPGRWSEVIVITDRVPVNKKRSGIEKAVKTALATMLPADARYRLLHHESRSCCGLQVADYFNWAVFRAWERDDHRSLLPLRRVIHSQIDLFRDDSATWY
jgi:hypothetical protein